jgi:quercetin dioxygenase-like cupin family protein
MRSPKSLLALGGHRALSLATVAALCGLSELWAQRVSPPREVAPRTRVREAIVRELPVMNGSRLRVTVLEVTYPPGGASMPHRHPCPVIGYVVRGAVRMQSAGAPERVYRAGESFYEEPNTTHVVSANASRARPATFIATFTCDQVAELSVPVTPTLRRHNPLP